MHKYIKESPVEIQNPAHWNLIGSSMTAHDSCVIAQQYSSAIIVSLRCHPRNEKFGENLKKCYQFIYCFS